MNVFVHLAHDKDVVKWRQGWEDGKLVGRNDPTPYGYGRAEGMGCRITYSQAPPENPLQKLVRLGLRVILGFDLVHAYHQRRAIRDADVVWTHTESQFLGVAALLPKSGGPKVIAQSVWLFDRWDRLNPFHKWLYARLIRRLDVLTFHSTVNMAVARRAFPEKDCRLVPFGIPSEGMTPPRSRGGEGLTIIAPGSDRHRDWATLVEAVSAIPAATTTILSGTAPKRLAQGKAAVSIHRARTNEEMNRYFDSAHAVCVPLKPNKHASGITVIQEAVLAGVPVVASAAGGLEGYFGPDEITFVPPGDASALSHALRAIERDPDAALAMARRAQEKMEREAMGAETYVKQHVEISRELLNRR